ncbi:MAG: hypothetical protein WD226_09360 [Planctomycetota bacterium]
MKTHQNYICPRCEYPLVPVHGRGDKQRHILALTCPEPYCDHIQVVTKGEAARLQGKASHAERVIS